MIKITLPLFVILPRKTKADKKIILNLNNYPHWHYITYNNAKKMFCDDLFEKLKELKLNPPIALHYTLYNSSNRKSDRMNTLAVIDKFFCDSLVNHNCIPDDSDEFISYQFFQSGGIDKENPRVEVEINYAPDTTENAS